MIKLCDQQNELFLQPKNTKNKSYQARIKSATTLKLIDKHL